MLNIIEAMLITHPLYWTHIVHINLLQWKNISLWERGEISIIRSTTCQNEGKNSPSWTCRNKTNHANIVYNEVLWHTKTIIVRCKICITNESSLPYTPMLSPMPKRMYIKFSGGNGVDGRNGNAFVWFPHSEKKLVLLFGATYEI